MDRPLDLQSLIETISYLIPLGIVIWNLAKLDAKVKQNEKDINGLAAKHHEDKTDLEEDVDLKYTELKEAIEESKMETRRETKEILETVTDIKVAIATIATKLDNIIK